MRKLFIVLLLLIFVTPSYSIMRKFSDYTERWYQGYDHTAEGMTCEPTNNYFGINKTSPGCELDIDGTVSANTMNCTNLTADNLEQDLDGTGYTITVNKFTDGTSIFTGGDLTGGLEYTIVTLNVTNLIAENLKGDLDATGYTITANTIDCVNLLADNLEQDIDATGFDITAIQNINATGIVTASTCYMVTATITNLEADIDITGYDISAVTDINASGVITANTIDCTNLEATNLERDLDGTGFTITATFVGDLTGDVTGTANNAITANYSLDSDKLDGEDSTYYTNADNLSSGTLADARLTGNYTLTNLEVDGIVTASYFVGDGSGVTGISLNGLPLTVVTSNYSGAVTLNNSDNLFYGTLTGTANYSNDSDKLDGEEGIYYTNASNLASGTVPDARMDSKYVTSNYTGIVTFNSLVNHEANIDASGHTITATTFIGALTGTATTANNADTLDHLDSTYFTNADNLASGTLPDARFTGEYTTATLNLTDLVATNLEGSLDGTGYDITITNLNAITALKLNGTNINIGGTLDNVAYLDQSNTFTNTNVFAGIDNGANPITVNSLEIVGVDGEVNASVIEDKFLRNDGADSTTGKLTAAGFDAGANAIEVNSLEIVGADGEVNASVIEDKFLRNDGNDETSGTLTASGFIGDLTGTATTASYATTSNYSNDSDKLDGQEGTYYLDASNINAGTLDKAYIDSEVVTQNYSGVVTLSNASNSLYGDGSNLTALNATQLTSGTVPDARIDNKYVTNNYYTSVSINGNLGLSTGVSVNEFSSDGTLAGNSDTAVPTEKAVKTYADTKLTAVRGNHKVFYSDGSGVFTELTLGADGTYLKSNGASSAPSFAAAGGSNIDTHKFTSASTWAALSGLGSATIVQVVADATDITEGKISISVDGGDQEVVVSTSESKARIIEASSSLSIYAAGFGYGLSTTSYDNVSLNVNSQDNQPRGVSFKTDGTKMYIVGSSNDRVYQYTLSTAWDMSTASYDSVSFSVNSQDTNPMGVTFKTDGTKMYVIGTANDRVYQYTLLTAWDLSTASYDSVSFFVQTQAGSPISVTFKTDGTKMYILEDTAANSKVYQYILSTAWDMSTASYDSVSYDVSTQEGDPSDVVFKTTDGTKMYIVGYANDKVHQYTTVTTFAGTGFATINYK